MPLDVCTDCTYSSLFDKITTKNIKTPEEILTHNIAVYLKNMATTGFSLVWFHVPNENFTHIAYSIKMNGMGRISGAPDFVIISKKNNLLIEVKAPDEKAKQSKNQKLFQEWCEKTEVNYFVVKSVKEVQHLVAKYII